MSKVDTSTRELAALNVVAYLEILVRTVGQPRVYTADAMTLSGRLSAMSEADRALCVWLKAAVEDSERKPSLSMLGEVADNIVGLFITPHIQSMTASSGEETVGERSHSAVRRELERLI